MTRYLIQERELSYRLFPHEHPFATRLAQRLIREGTRGLQAADTEYAPDGRSLPGSLELTLDAASGATVPGGAPLVLLGELAATLPGGAQLELSANMHLELAGDATTRLQAGTQAILIEGMAGTPPPGSALTLAEDRQAVLPVDTRVTLPEDSDIRLNDGQTATIPAGTRVVLPARGLLTLPAGTRATLLRSRPLPALYGDILTPERYDPSPLVERPYPAQDLDLGFGGAYSVYNWELFFHVPLTIAIHLGKNGRYVEAQRWFHYVFDPTDDGDGPTPQRFWQVRPFQTTDVHKIEEILVNLATGADPALREETIRAIDAWRAAPFRPHVIARHRQQAYMVKTVMAYLDNLIAWGDSLFRQDTGEAIDEALMLYVLAANILGPRPQPVPQKGSIRPQTYANLRQDLRQLGTVVRDVEADLPFDLSSVAIDGGGDTDRLAPVRSLGRALYFCTPRNDKLLSYWDTVEDRLFKIRNSLNIQGIFRQLALFEPPIDPALLARAVAAGLDVGAIVNGLNQPLPLVRFQLLVQKATEMAQEVRALGGHLLSAMEKEDGEALAILRARHERAVMEMVEQVKYAQLQEAIKSREGLLQSMALAVQRYTYYERQLGKEPDEIEKAIPELAELDRAGLEKMRLVTQEPQVGLREIEVNIADDLGDSGGKIISDYEAEELAKSGRARAIQDSVRLLQLLAKTVLMVPDPKVDGHYWGIGGTIELPGGRKLAGAAEFAAEAALAYSDRLNYEAGSAARLGSYDRREQEWAFQSNQAAGEIGQIFKQLRAAQIREAIAEQELKAHRRQIKQAEEIERFLNAEGTEPGGKKTNQALYTWMKREVKSLYAQCFQFAFDIGKKAERALQHELGDPALAFLQFGYLAGKEGLLAGERLYLDVKRMEMAYHELNRREYELTKHVSLLQVDPAALIQLRATGRCTVRLPEAMFDMDGPGHYFRRIKTVGLSIPCVTGPYAGVNCTLRLLRSSIRQSPAVGDGYARADAEDTRFSDYYGSVQSIVTSSAQNDSGLFETSLRDERLLPFENAGVIGEWQLELPADPSQEDPAQFDYDTISDVILHMRYTAREGGGVLRRAAMDNLKAAIEEAQTAGSVRLFSVRHEFPSEWARFKSARPGDGDTRVELALPLGEHHYPFWSQGRLDAVERVDLYARAPQDVTVSDEANGDGTQVTLGADPAFGGLRVGQLDPAALPPPTGTLRLFFDETSIDDLLIAITWS